MNVTKKPSFWVGAIAWRDFQPHALSVVHLEEALNKHLCLNDYGPAMTSFNFIPMVLSPENRIHEEEIEYSRRKRELNIQLKLDYQEVINAGLVGFLPLVGQLLLRAIDESPQQRIKDFNWSAFRKDIENLLSANGWLLSVEQT